MTSPSQTPTQVSLLSDKKYAIVLQLATLILPLIQALYFGLGELWNLPNVVQITGTIALLNVFFGALAAVAKKFYDASGAKYDGTVDVSVDADGKKKFLLNVAGDPDDLDKKSEIIFKVNAA
jgi:hypothetical protein